MMGTHQSTEHNACSESVLGSLNTQAPQWPLEAYSFRLRRRVSQASLLISVRACSCFSASARACEGVAIRSSAPSRRALRRGGTRASYPFSPVCSSSSWRQVSPPTVSGAHTRNHLPPVTEALPRQVYQAIEPPGRPGDSASRLTGGMICLPLRFREG